MASPGWPSTYPFTIGNRRSAREVATAATTSTLTSPAPDRSMSRIRSRKSISSEASTSSMVWMWGISDQACTMLRATTPRMPRRPWRPTGAWPSPSDAVGRSFESSAGSVGDGAAAWMSSRVIRPPGPVPIIVVRSTPRSRARRRVAGAALGRAVRGATSGGGSVGWDFAVSVWVEVGSSATLGVVLPSSISINTSPTCSRVPSLAPSRSTVPATGEGSSELALSVRTSTRGWSRRTSSPMATNHSTISASSRPSPISGRRKMKATERSLRPFQDCGEWRRLFGPRQARRRPPASRLDRERRSRKP